jgi:hypothetical protein
VDPSYTRSVTTAAAANGTTRSLLQTFTGFNGGSELGVHRDFEFLHPKSVSWWARPSSATAHGTYFVIYSASGTIVFHHFDNTGQIVLNQSPSPVLTPYTANTWYHFELRNMNWSTATYDYYVNGVLTKAGAKLVGIGNSLRRIALFHYDATSGYWDEIELR